MESFDFMDYKRYEHISKGLEDDRLITCDLGIWFRLERVSSNYGFQRKMTSLFQEVSFRDLKVLRRGGDTYYRATLNKWNMAKFLKSPNLGIFGDDYSITINGVYVNEEEGSESEVEEPETPLKAVEQHKKNEDNVLQIDLKKSSEKNGPMARGVHTYNLLSNFTEIENIMTHFNITFEDVEALIKPTPAIPSLLVVLKKSLSDWVKETDVRRDPFLLYQPAPQSERMGRTQIWAHAVLEDNQLERRVTIEGIYKRVSNAEVVHTLSYNGDVLTKPQPLTWKGSDLPNGDLMVNMKLHTEMNFIIIKGESYKVSYARQEKQCTHCFSFSHKNFECERWEADGRTLMFDYYKKWQRQVGFKEYQPLRPNPEDDVPQTPPQRIGSASESPAKPKKTPSKENVKEIQKQQNPEDKANPKKPSHEETANNSSTEAVPDQPQKPQVERKNDGTAKEGPDKDDVNPEILLEDFGAKYNLQGTSSKTPGLEATISKATALGSVQRKLFGEDDLPPSVGDSKESGQMPSQEASSEEVKSKGDNPNGSTQEEAGAKGTEKGRDEDKVQDHRVKSPKRNEKLEGLDQGLTPEGGGDKVVEGQKEQTEGKEGIIAESKKRKNSSSATKLTPENKKAHGNEKPVLLKEMKKMEEESVKKDLTEVKKKVLKSRLESYLNSKKDEIKRMTDDDQREFERTEANIRSSLGKSK